LVPTASAVVVQVATLELMVLAEQPDNDDPPNSKLTVPVAPEVTVAVSVREVPAICGEEGDAVRVVVVEVAVESVTVVALELIDWYVPSLALVAVTMQVPVLVLERAPLVTEHPEAVPLVVV
jgi:hypothetical protein